MLIWKNTLLSNSTVFSQNQALSGGFASLKIHKFWGRFVWICCWTLNYYMVLLTLTWKNTLISTPQFTHKSKRWVGGLVHLNTRNFGGRLFLICRWTLNCYMALWCFSYLQKYIDLNSAVFPQNQALSGLICTFKHT